MLKKILVTGGAGFIGSHTVVELANAGYEPVIVDNFSNSSRSVLKNLKKILAREVACYAGDCCDRLFLEQVFTKEKNIQGAIHFAALKAVGDSVKEPLLYYRNNLDSLLVLLDVMKEYGAQLFVFSSSATVYGAADRLPVTEETPLKPAECPYGATKQMGEQIVRDAVTAGYGLKAVSLRYFNPIGAHETALIGELPIGVPKNLVPYVTQVAAGLLPELTVHGNDYSTPDGTPIRDYIHVLDLSAAHVAALKHLNETLGHYDTKALKNKDTGALKDTGTLRHSDTMTLKNKGAEKPDVASVTVSQCHSVSGLSVTVSQCLSAPAGYDVFNLGTGRGNSVMEVISTFEKATGVKLKYKIGPRRPGDIESIYADASKAEKLLGWKAKRSLSDSLKSAWEWQKNISVKGKA
jgi:UDP-glucose 4-epimerase